MLTALSPSAMWPTVTPQTHPTLLERKAFKRRSHSLLGEFRSGNTGTEEEEENKEDDEDDDDEEEEEEGGGLEEREEGVGAQRTI